MLDIPPASVSVRLGVFYSPSFLFGTVSCPHCEGPLAVHQPDLERSERLLGVCKDCASWCLMELMPDEAACLVVPLPVGDFFRAAVGAELERQAAPLPRPPAPKLAVFQG
jgi:hypothetical protein